MKKLQITLLLFFFHLTAPLFGDAKEELVGVVENLLEELYTETPATEGKRKEKLRTIITTKFNFEAIARRALGHNWNRFKESQQKEFVELFTGLLVNTYADRYDGKIRPTISWGESIDLARNRIEIHSVVSLDGQNYQVLYRLALLEDQWQVYDVIIEGVSLVGNYRQQFDSVLSRQKPEDLLKILREKNQ
jgi:phospholipid transport system substrate-binding protein